MDWHLYIFLPGILALGSFFVALAIHSDRRRRAFDQAMEARPVIPLETIYRAGGYAFIVSEPRFISLWTTIGRALEIDPRRMSPSDTFEQLRPKVTLDWGGPDGLDLVEMLHRDSWDLLEQVCTVDDFFQLAVRHGRNA